MGEGQGCKWACGTFGKAGSYSDLDRRGFVPVIRRIRWQCFPQRPLCIQYR